MRHAVAAVSLSLAAIAFLASPAQAEAAGTAPAGGAAPVLSDLLILPTVPTATAPATDAISPLAGEIINAQNNAERLGEQLKSIGDELKTAQAATAPIRTRSEQADAAVTALKDQLAAATSPSPSPSDSTSPSPSPSPSASPSAQTAPAVPVVAAVPGDEDTLMAELAAAQHAAAAARAALDSSVLVESEISGRYAVVNEQFQRAQSALSVLKARNADQIAAVDSARDNFENAQAAARNVSSAVNGMVAGAAAQRAVAFALSQLGKPYAWAEEGPDAYDCSGLTFASYLSVGIRLPRVAVDQYMHGPGTYVPVTQLLPGDLLFFSTDHNDPSKIHHVAMYLGGGRMVHAPTFGEHVKEAPIWWTEYYGALRVVPAAAAPGTTGAPPAPTQPAPTQPAPTEPPPSQPDPTQPAPTTTPVPVPTTSPSPDPAPSPSTSASPDPTTPPVVTTPPTTAPAPAPPPPTTSTSTPPATSTPSSTPSPSPRPSPTPAPSPAGAVLAILGTGSLALGRPPRKRVP
jgi:cell wall-associated NlpC family hydrolase